MMISRFPIMPKLWIRKCLKFAGWREKEGFHVARIWSGSKARSGLGFSGAHGKRQEFTVHVNT
jgi:hypothetical protein